MKLYKLLLIVALQIIVSTVMAAPFVYIVTDLTVQVIDASTNTIVDTIAGLVSGDCIVITPDNKFAYVTDGGPNNVLVIDLATNTIITTITSPQFNFVEGGLAITPNGETVYVANDSSDTVTMIDVATNTVIGSGIGVGNGPFSIAITPDGTTAYVSNSADNTVSVINLATNMVTDIINSVQFNGILSIAITPDGKTAYVANSLGNTVSVIDIATNTIVGSSIVVGSAPFGLTMTPDGTTLYVVNAGGSGTVSVIDIATNTVIGSPIIVGGSPSFMAILSDGSFGYVTEDVTNTVSVINIATNEIIDVVNTDPVPYGIASTNATNLIASVTGIIEYDIFLNRKEAVFVVTWEPFFASTVSYRVFNSNGDIIGTVSAQGSLQLLLCFCSITETQGLSIAAVSPTGTESNHIPVTII